MNQTARRDSGEPTELRIGKRLLSVSNPDKLMWPRAGFTKGQMIDFYLAISEALLPHVRDRPLTLKRAPGGVDEDWWFQTECPHPPDWIPTVPVEGARPGKVWNYCTAKEPAALVWFANMGCIELHPLLFEAKRSQTPCELIFDLDPGPAVGMTECCRIALLLRKELARTSLQAFVKTSGLTGVHVHVPLQEGSTFDDTKGFARAIAHRLTEEYPDEVTDQRQRSARLEKVLVDWSQNDRFASVVAPYSLRAASFPMVATPIDWTEVEAALETQDSRLLTFLPDQVIERVSAGIDPFAGLRDAKETLPSSR